MKQWPKIGSKIRFREASRWFWFTDMVKDAEELLEPGKEYTVSSLSLGSSWCGVVLEEFPAHKFSLSWFEYPEELTTEEVREQENER